MTSSNSITWGSIASARAIATRCCCPPESRSGYSSALSESPTRSSSSRAFRTASSRGAVEHLLLREADVVERRLVREQVELLEDHRPRAGARSRAGRAAAPVISSPSSTIRPSSGGSSRLTQRSSVLLPEPLGPITQTTEPFGTTRSIPRSTWRSPKRLCTPCSSSIGWDSEAVTSSAYAVASPRWVRAWPRAM